MLLIFHNILCCGKFVLWMRSQRNRGIGRNSKNTKNKKMEKDGVATFLEQLPHVSVVQISKVCEIPEILALCCCSKKLNTWLSHNLVWQSRARDEIPEYSEIHPADLKRMQSEGFWKKWYLDRVCRPFPIYSPKFYKLPARRISGDEFYAEDEFITGGEALLPEVGSICFTSKGAFVAGVLTTKHTYYVVLEQKLNSKGFPVSYRMSEMELSLKKTLKNGRTRYKRMKEMTVKCSNEGVLSGHMCVVDLDDVAKKFEAPVLI